MLLELKKRLEKSPLAHRFAYACYVQAGTLLGMPRYLACRFTNKVYLGPVMLGRQTWGTRVPHMRRPITEQFSRTDRAGEFHVLEIGSWAGQSAMLWGDELRRSGRPGKVFCIDTWKPFASREQISGSAGVAAMDRAARRDKIFRCSGTTSWHLGLMTPSCRCGAAVKTFCRCFDYRVSTLSLWTHRMRTQTS